MAGRIRTIKPEWLEDERLLEADSDARVLSVALLLLADDSGRGRGSDRFLAGQVFCGDAPRTMAALAALTPWYACRYRVRGQTYFEVCNWLKHQKIDRPSKPRTPDPGEGEWLDSRDPREDSSRARNILEHDLDPDPDQDPDREGSDREDSTQAMVTLGFTKRYADLKAVPPSKNKHYHDSCRTIAVWVDATAIAAEHRLSAFAVVDRLLNGFFATTNPKVKGDWHIRFLANDCSEFYGATAKPPKPEPKRKRKDVMAPDDFKTAAKPKLRGKK